MYKLIILFVLIIILGVSLNYCIDSNESVCGETFTETEFNDSVNLANDFGGIVMKPGCKITITGTIGTTDSDYFRISTGEAATISFLVSFDAVDAIDLYLYNEFGTQVLEQSFGVNDFDVINRTVLSPYTYRVIEVRPFNGNANYTLTIEGF